jgi:hypothetical protein
VNSNSTCPEALGTFIKPMLGLPAWSVKQGHGSFLTFEFGDPRLEVTERSWPQKGSRRSAYLRGQWRLWIYCCHWRALQYGIQVAWSEDTDQLIGRATATFDAQKLVGVRVAPDDGCSTFTFDRGGALETWPYGDDPKDKQWMILTNTEAFVYRADGHYACGPNSIPPAFQRWSPLR